MKTFHQKNQFRVLFTPVLAISTALIMACTKTVEYDPLPPFVDPYAAYSFEEKPVWQDEFDYTGQPNPAKWGYDLGGNGWGNQELQNYTNRTANVRVENGKLIIEAIKETFDKNNYTSARLVSKNKGDWTYGRFVIRAKIPDGRGTWPAIWMLPTNQTYGTQYWPDNGEIDIMEHVGFDPTVIHGTIHTKSFNHGLGTQKGGKSTFTNAFSEFNDYIMEWTPTKIKVFVNEKMIFEFSKPSNDWQAWPFDKPFHLLLNIAVGGSWGGQKGIDDSVFPKRMEVEYVRVYALKK
jgi:beta-glucanase (GH16 family)